jgi:hypothetical protein
MLKVVTLYTINEIFKEYAPKGANARMIYISCLIQHFESLEPSEKNAMQFEMKMTDCKYKKFAASYFALAEVGLITLLDDHILFNNAWGQHIDRLALTKSSDPEDTLNGVLNWEDELKRGSRMKDHIRRTFKLSEIQYDKLLEQFISEQAASKRVYTSESDVLSHFQNWAKYNVDKPAAEKVISAGKRLGDEDD